MTLRGRLTLGYSVILALVVMLFGGAVYFSLSLSLISQIETTLIRTADEILRASQMPESLVIALRGIDLTSNVFVQLWEASGRLVWQSGNLERIQAPFDAQALLAVHNSFSSQYVGSQHVRVLTVPLVAPGSEAIVGHLQLAASLAMLDRTQEIMLLVLVGGGVLAIGMAGVVGWVTAGAALRPLDQMTETALSITRADDLSRRIPFSTPASGEVGQLIIAFNETLERLEALFETQRRFLADVSHELRTPLTVIRGNADVIRRMGPDDESLEVITSEVDRMSRMVNDLLLLAKAESGNLPLAEETVELDTLLLEVFQQGRVLAKERVEVCLAEEDQARVIGDRDRLKQVLLNLVANAVEVTAVGGTVTLGLVCEDGWAKLSVSDTGPGIPEEERAHIFERFYRLDRSRKRSGEGGAGLGLSIAYWIVRRHGGRIEVLSQMGKGSVFVVWLPLEARERSSSQAERRQPA